MKPSHRPARYSRRAVGARLKCAPSIRCRHRRKPVGSLLFMAPSLLSEEVGPSMPMSVTAFWPRSSPCCGDFDLAEEMMQEAFCRGAAAVVRVRNSFERARMDRRAARHKAIDRLRRDAVFRAKFPDCSAPSRRREQQRIHSCSKWKRHSRMTGCASFLPAVTRRWPPRRRSRLLFGRSAASRPRKSRARFWCRLRPWPSRLVRVKRKITEAAIPYSVPPARCWPRAWIAVLVTVYLIFTAGYTASSGAALRQDGPLC